MGWASYVIDGRPCGYAVAALCDDEYCFVRIDRGLGWRCGDLWDDEDGCGGYYCSEHLYDHACTEGSAAHSRCRRDYGAPAAPPTAGRRLSGPFSPR